MSADDPWAEIQAADVRGKLYVRRVDQAHRHDFYWGRDSEGCRLMMLALPENFDIGSLSVPQIRGLSIDVMGGQFVIRLKKGEDQEIFVRLCRSLIERTRTAGSVVDVVHLLITHLERWRKFLGRSDPDILSDREIRGLICELVFLKCELMTRFGEKSIRYWTGPQGAPQDFAIGNSAFEVKSHSTGAGAILTISSAEQLWQPQGGQLFLFTYAIGEADASAYGARSLSDWVEQVRNGISSAVLLEEFEGRLFELGYVDNPAYEIRWFVVSSPISFLVSESFPRITADAIMQGVRRVNYGVEVAACLPFRSMPDWVSLGVTADDE